jgi:MFS family permease
LLCSSFILKETHAPTILHKLHAHKKADAADAADAAYEPTPDQPDPAVRLSRAIKRPLKLLFFSPVIMTCSLIISVVAGTMNLIFASLGRIFQNQYGFSTSASGLMYLGVTTGFLIGAFLFGWTSDRISRWLTLRNDGQREAEFRLPALMVGLPLVVTGLVWYGWSAQNHVFWLVVVLGLNVFGMGVTTIQVGFSHQERV